MDTNLVLKFHFDDYESSLSNDNLIRKVGVSSSSDRFGNQNAACYFQGNTQSYVNLGTSHKLKPKKGTISLWFRLDEVVFSGQGYTHNVIILTKSHVGNDFFEGYMIDYDYQGKRIIGAVTQSSLNQLSIRSTDTLNIGKWYHSVLTFDDNYLCLYVNGVLQNKLIKKFPNFFLETDSVMLGNSANLKNLRFFNGAIDDVEIYHRVLNEKEILKLYNASNPNRNSVFMHWILLILIIIIFIIITIFFIKIRIRNILKKKDEKNQILLHSLEQEIKMLQAQMDPHFIFNSLNTILQFILTKENEKAELYLTKFSKLIRKIIESNINEQISLKDELYILQNYIDIESIRFDKIITPSIEIDEDIDTGFIFIPHMMIQPFVENAIWHGFRLKEGERKLNLSFKKQDKNTLCVTVEDNGIGRHNELKNKKREGRSLAINFIEQRLQLMNKKYNNFYKLIIIDKEKNAGTIVKITIPIIEKTNE